MAEYIERESAIKAVEMQCVDGKMYGRDDGEGTLVDAYDIIDAISDAPAADVVEVRHGQYISTGYYEFYCEFGDCSICGANMPRGSDYCPNCGAKMDGGDDNEHIR